MSGANDPHDGLILGTEPGMTVLERFARVSDVADAVLQQFCTPISGGTSPDFLPMVVRDPLIQSYLPVS